jgi:diguanylate cyclase (GGDEF)-like protein
LFQKAVKRKLVNHYFGYFSTNIYDAFIGKLPKTTIITLSLLVYSRKCRHITIIETNGNDFSIRLTCMTDEKNRIEKTEFAPAERMDREGLLHQYHLWSEQLPTSLISNSIPGLILILNEYRQIVFSNDQFTQLGNYSSYEDYLGLRPGELINCEHASETPAGCGTTRFCATCGAVNAILNSINGQKDIQECIIERGSGILPLNLRVWTTPVELSQDKFVIFTVQDISVEKENARLLEQVQKLAIMDPLTDIYNRRIFFDVANREIVRSIRYHNPFSIVMVDLDCLKQVNDTYGHPAGDAVLKEVVKVIKANLREIDTFARYGGDEFIILLPETGLVGGKKVANRIMEAGDSTLYTFKDFEIPILFSAGVAEFDFDGDHDIDDVIARADKELYITKKRRKEIKLD